MRTTLTNLFSYLCLSLLMLNCSKNDDLTGRVYSAFDDTNKTLSALQFFDDGRVLSAGFSDELLESQLLHIWDNEYNIGSYVYNILPYRKEEGKIIVSYKDKDISEFKMSGNNLKMKVLGSNEEYVFKNDGRVMPIKKTNKYAGKTYECITKGIKFGFVSDNYVFFVEKERRPELRTYEIADDNTVIIRDEGIELTPEKETLKMSFWTGSLTFRKTNNQPITESDFLDYIEDHNIN